MASTTTLPAPVSAKTEERDATRLEFEDGVIELFSGLAKMLGSPRSIGGIYGLLFISPEPLSMDDLMDRLGISKGAASMGLRQLREFGAVTAVKPPGERREYYSAETSLKGLVRTFLEDRLLPRLDAGGREIERLAALLDDTDSDFREAARGRLEKLTTWHRKTRRGIPLALQLLRE